MLWVQPPISSGWRPWETHFTVVQWDQRGAGKTYAELPQDDSVRATMMNASFLRASLFTSVVSFGVAAFAIGIGILSILFGLALNRLAAVPVIVRRSAVTRS